MNGRQLIAVAGALCLFAGLAFTCVGVDKLHEAQHCSKKPVEITAAQLRSYRPEGNTHITLTKFVPYLDGIFFVEHPEIHSRSFWVPVLPADAPRGDRKQIVAIVQLSKTPDEASLERALARSEWTGLLHSQGGLPYASDIRRLNPGINLDRCWLMWEGHTPETVSGALPFVIVPPCLFVLGMVLAGVVALRPAENSPGGSANPMAFLMIVPYFLFSALGEGIRWLHRRGWLTGHAALLLAALGFASVGSAAYVLNQEWDQVVRVTGEMYLAIFGGLFGVGLLVYAVLLGVMRLSADPAPYERIQGADSSIDPRKIAGTLAVVGLFLLAIDVNQFKRDDISFWTHVFAGLGLGALLGSGVWLLRLSGKVEQEKKSIWN
jgi:hypothetical protein